MKKQEVGPRKFLVNRWSRDFSRDYSFALTSLASLNERASSGTDIKGPKFRTKLPKMVRNWALRSYGLVPLLLIGDYLLLFFFELHLLDVSSGNAAVGALVVCVSTTDTWFSSSDPTHLTLLAHLATRTSLPLYSGLKLGMFKYETLYFVVGL